MPRSGSFFVALCMVTIAVSVAALAYLVANVEAGFSTAIGFGLLLAMVIGHLGSQRSGDRLVVEARLADLTRVTGDVARDMTELARRVERFETMAMDKARAATEPIAEEIGQLGALVKQFAETLQVHEAAIVRATAVAVQPAAALPPVGPLAASLSAAVPATSPDTELPPQAADVPVAAATQAQGANSQRLIETLRQRLDRSDLAPALEAVLPDVFDGLSRAEAVASITAAIDSRRIDLYLQPIVTLPQRKVRWYQASVRLRSADGDLLLPSDYRELAETAGLMPALDVEALGRCIQVVRRLTSRNRDVGLVCDLAGVSLGDAAFSTELVALLDANRALAGSLVLGFRQDAVRNLSPLDIETLGALSDLGFRFAMDGVGDLRIEPRDLAEKGFRQIKVPADLMLARAGAAGAAIHPADLAGLFARYGIDFVVEGIETEPLVVDLLDYEVKFAQGPLFSPPRPVRAEVLSEAAAAPAPQPAPAARAPRSEPRAEPRPAEPQSLGAAALALGAVGAPREARRAGGIGQGLRALIRERS
ncbi:EAL domain-containing protein [Phreatobacter stygius]|uniref:EAL domain-containing protein n=1 Tax=Phreatobacter stygius TaxID=1940610 RepID=A0A4D7BCL9_9HYPH|nr:EAL domain-containing protein [Phreatobacter stygius]QCI65762.1 EAL domain-containing protein [Phreatobacter stygius]